MSFISLAFTVSMAVCEAGCDLLFGGLVEFAKENLDKKENINKVIIVKYFFMIFLPDYIGNILNILKINCRGFPPSGGLSNPIWV
jgi:hypothetical protein